eukprot:scaffold17338_cov88-Skeletonema_dohrnii-CCMP3373.AAC.4
MAARSATHQTSIIRLTSYQDHNKVDAEEGTRLSLSLTPRRSSSKDRDAVTETSARHPNTPSATALLLVAIQKLQSIFERRDVISPLARPQAQS